VWNVVEGGPARHVYRNEGAVLRLVALKQTHTPPVDPSKPDVVIVSTSSEGALRAYSGDGSEMVGELAAAHSSSILCVEVCACSSRMVTGCRDGSVKVWHVKQAAGGRALDDGIVGGSGSDSSPHLSARVTFECLATLNGHTRWITSVTLDHYRVMTASLEGLRLWSFSSDDVHNDTPQSYQLLPSYLFPGSGMVYNSRRKLKTGDTDPPTESFVSAALRPKGEAAKTLDQMISAGKARFWKSKCDVPAKHAV
jgi:WD40 repeat protein